MIARLLICPSINRLKEELSKTLRSHLTSHGPEQSRMGGKVNHPDLLYIQAGEKLGIAEAKKIKDHFYLKPYSAQGKVVILEDASVLTVEAQNALLKTIEELPKEAIIILGAASDANLLPTILSRCEITNLQSGNDDTLEYHSKYFQDLELVLSATTEERFAYVEKLKDREEFLRALVQYFHNHLLDYPKFTAELLQAEQRAKQNVNIRAILEYLMLVMPKK